VHIDSIEQRSAHLGEIALDYAGSAATLARGVAIKAAWAGIHRANQHQASRKSKRAIAAGQRDRTLLKRLAQLFQYAPRKFGQFVEEQDALMRQTYFAGTRASTAVNSFKNAYNRLWVLNDLATCNL